MFLLLMYLSLYFYFILKFQNLIILFIILIDHITYFKLKFYIFSINANNYLYFSESLKLNPEIYYSDNSNVIRKNDIPNEYISDNSGLN